MNEWVVISVVFSCFNNWLQYAKIYFCKKIIKKLKPVIYVQLLVTQKETQ